MLTVVPQWARLLLWPAHLQADYSPQEIVSSTGLGAPEAAGAALVLVAAAGAWIARKRAPVASFGFLWAGLALLPVSNVLVPTGVVLAERTLFLPSMGFLLAVGGILGAVWQRYPEDPSRSRVVYWSILSVVTVLGVLRSASREGQWSSPEVYVTRTATDAPSSWKGPSRWRLRRLRARPMH